MASRMDKYSQNMSGMSRSEKNKNIYKNVSQNDYFSYEKLPVSSNVNEINIYELKKIATNRDEYRKLKELENTISLKRSDIKEEEVKVEKEEPIYDINELLAKARREKEKLQEVQKKIINTNYNFLSSLESSYEKVSDGLEVIHKDDVKYQTKKINDNPSIEQIMDETRNLSLDILSDLKPTDNTIVTPPIKDDVQNKSLEDTKGEDFYSNTYKFSKKDFMSDTELENKKGGSIFLKILIVVLTFALVGLAILYVLHFFNIDIINYSKILVKFM